MTSIDDLFPTQPDYGACEGPSEWAVPAIVAGMWAEGDDEDRAFVDDLLRRGKRQHDRCMADMQHEWVFGAKAWF